MHAVVVVVVSSSSSGRSRRHSARTFRVHDDWGTNPQPTQKKTAAGAAWPQKNGIYVAYTPAPGGRTKTWHSSVYTTEYHTLFSTYISFRSFSASLFLSRWKVMDAWYLSRSALPVLCWESCLRFRRCFRQGGTVHKREKVTSRSEALEDRFWGVLQAEERGFIVPFTGVKKGRQSQRGSKWFSSG